MTDTEILDYIESQEGSALISDDRGHWAMTMAGMQSVPEKAPDDIETWFYVEKDQWKKTIREAVIAYKNS